VKQRFILRSIQIGAAMFAASLVLSIVVSTAMAQDPPAEHKPEEAGKAAPTAIDRDILIAKVFAAGGTMGISLLAAAYAVGKVGAAALGAASEKPELLNRALVYVALGEGLAILGLVVALMIFRL
jgi:V/A-type H+-transporting ATPase subunit K